MKLEKTYEKSKGITLVALVMTIVILLILAGISIAQLTGNGLFKNAKLAKEKSDNAQQQENDTLSDYESKIGEYIDGIRNDIGTSGYNEETGFHYQIFQNKFCILYQNYTALDTTSTVQLNFPFEFVDLPTCQLTKTSATSSTNNMVISNVLTKNVSIDTNYGYNAKCSFAITVFGVIK